MTSADSPCRGLRRIVLVVVCLVPARAHGDRAIEIGNERVRARFTSAADGGITQEYLARDALGEWRRVANSFHAPRPFPPAGNRLWDVDAGPQRWLVNDAFQTAAIEPAAGDVQRVRLRGTVRDAVVELVVTVRPGAAGVHVEVSATIPGAPPRLDYLLSTFAFDLDRVPAFVHTPTLKYDEPRWPGPARDQVLGDRCFHSPAVILQEGGLCCALVPDLTAINQHRLISPDARRQMNIPRNKFSVPIEPDRYTMPTALDLNVASGLTVQPLLSFGLMDYVVAHHVRYLRANDGSMVRTLGAAEVRYAFDLLLAADAPPCRGYQEVTRFLWRRHGHEVFAGRPHLAMPFADYVRLVTDATLRPLGAVHPPVPGFRDTGSFLSFELAGREVGGYRCAVPGLVDALSNSEFWNNVRDAVGMHAWGRRLDEPRLIDMADRTIELALIAPQDDRGMFPLTYRAATGTWVRNLFSAASGRNSTLLTHADREGDTYNVVAMSKTARHLLQYHERCRKDPRILAYVRRYADGLLPLVAADGTVPSYVSAAGEPYAPLARSPQSATSMALLAELSILTRETAHREAARRIGDDLIRRVLPRQAWTDMEQHYSCGNKPLAFTGDTEQGQPARGNLAPLWAAEGFASLHRATGDTRYLDAGEQCIDYLTFTQCSWEPHFVYTAFPFGGFTVDNADTAVSLDGRQAEAVAALAWYGRTLGRQDLLERAVAAARSSVVLVRHPRHEGANDIYRHPNIYPVGLGPENIDHEGHPQSAMRTSPSWGEASGVFTGLAEATWQLGGAYVDIARGVAVGVDGLRIDRAAIAGRTLELTIVDSLAALPQPWDRPFTTELRVVGLAPGTYDLRLNGAAAIAASADDLANLPLRILPDGRIEAGRAPPAAEQEQAAPPTESR